MSDPIPTRLKKLEDAIGAPPGLDTPGSGLYGAVWTLVERMDALLDAQAKRRAFWLGLAKVLAIPVAGVVVAAAAHLAGLPR